MIVVVCRCRFAVMMPTATVTIHVAGNRTRLRTDVRMVVGGRQKPATKHIRDQSKT